MDNLFNLDDLLEGGKLSSIPVGIHTGVSVSQISRKKTPKGNSFVSITYKLGNNTIDKALWQAKGNYPLDDETQEQAIAREERENLRHLAVLVKIFLTEEERSNFPKLSYDAWVDKAISVLTPKLGSKLVNLKVIYDSDGMYPELGRYPDYVELHVPGESAQLEYTDYERQNRITKKEGKKKEDSNPYADLKADVK